MTKFLFTNFGQTILLNSVDADDTEFLVNVEHLDRFPDLDTVEPTQFALTLWDGEDPQEIVWVQDVNSTEGVFTVLRAQEGTSARAWLAGTQLRLALTKESISGIIQEGFLTGNLATEAEAIEGVANDVLMTPYLTEVFFEDRTTAYMRGFLKSGTISEARSFLGFETASFDGTGLQDSFTLPDASWDNPYTRVYVDEVFVPDTDYVIVGDQITFDTPPGVGTDNVVVVKGISFAFSVSIPGDNTVGANTIIDNSIERRHLTDDLVGPDELDNASVGSNHLLAELILASHINVASGNAILKVLQIQGASIPAVAALDLTVASGQVINITGNTNITSISLAGGRSVWVYFSGTPTIVPSSTLKVNGGGANVAITAGDFALIIRANSISYVWLWRASGKSVVPPTWAEVTGKPATFPVAAHTHPWTDITGKPATFPPSAHTQDWSTITGKPTTFAPSAHTHTWTSITGKPATFPPSTHSHTKADITSWPQVGEVGSFGFFEYTPNTALHPGDTVAGATLRYSNSQINGFSSGSPAGTWQCCGDTDDGGGDDQSTTVFTRIA